jgi:hypothetical protein
MGYEVIPVETHLINKRASDRLGVASKCASVVQTQTTNRSQPLCFLGDILLGILYCPSRQGRPSRKHQQTMRKLTLVSFGTQPALSEKLEVSPTSRGATDTRLRCTKQLALPIFSKPNDTVFHYHDDFR